MSKNGHLLCDFSEFRQQEIVDLGRWARIRSERMEGKVGQRVELVADDTFGV